MGKFIKKEQKVKLQHTDNKHSNVKTTPHHPKVKLEQVQPKIEKIKQEMKEKTNENHDKKKTFKHARFIIRNLVFDISQKHITKLISPFGTIRQINMPRHPDKNTNKGFAFVEMENKNQCLKAIKQLNGSTYKGRTIVLDMSVSKENFMTEKLKQNENKDKMKDQNQEDGNDEIKDEDQENSVKEQKQQPENEDDDDQVQNENSDSEEDQSKENLRIMKQKQDHLLEIFIRNIPISITQKDLFKHFSKHGQISIVKVVKNKQTGLSKGTAFIKFNDPEIAQKLIQYSRSYQMYLMKKIKYFVPDPSIKLQIDGMIMKIFPVQSRSEIQDKLKQRDGQNKTQKTKKPVKKIKKLQDLVKTDIHGKRKLVLSLIGKWKAQENMNKNDYEMFKNHQKEKIQKLKNPNQSVSSTRVILKHLDKSITQQQIRQFCNNFLNQKNLGGNNLTYCKLMLEKDMKKSAGFAFVQFKKHETARQFIQLLAKSPKLLQKQLFVVQFAIQDSRKMLKLKKRTQKDTHQQNTKQKDSTKSFQKHKQIQKQRTNKTSKIQRKQRK